jgi:hypothetical protein
VVELSCLTENEILDVAIAAQHTVKHVYYLMLAGENSEHGT